MLLDQVDALAAQINKVTTRIDELIAAIPAAQAPAQDGVDAGPGSGDDAQPGLAALDRIAEIPGVGLMGAQVILAEVGLDMKQFPTAKHLVSWAKLSPRSIQSGPVSRSGKTGKGNPYLKSVLGEAAASAARTNTFLGARYRRLVKHRGKLKALVAVARSILVIVWELLADPHARFRDLGADYHDTRIDKDRKTRNHLRQLQALGYQVTLTPAA